jgi:ammonia channel protein AmtB
MAGVTPAAGYVTHGAALMLGFMLGAAACISASVIRSRLNIDDALDVSSVHGVTGILGSLFVGFCFSDGALVVVACVVVAALCFYALVCAWGNVHRVRFILSTSGSQ